LPPLPLLPKEGSRFQTSSRVLQADQPAGPRSRSTEAMTTEDEPQQEATTATRTPPLSPDHPPMRASTPPFRTTPSDSDRGPPAIETSAGSEQPSAPTRDTLPEAGLQAEAAEYVYTSPPRHARTATPSTPVPELQLLNDRTIPKIQVRHSIGEGSFYSRLHPAVSSISYRPFKTHSPCLVPCSSRARNENTELHAGPVERVHDVRPRHPHHEQCQLRRR